MSPEGGYSATRIIKKYLKTQNMIHLKQTITFTLKKLKQVDYLKTWETENTIDYHKVSQQWKSHEKIYMMI